MANGKISQENQVVLFQFTKYLVFFSTSSTKSGAQHNVITRCAAQQTMCECGHLVMPNSLQLFQNHKQGSNCNHLMVSEMLKLWVQFLSGAQFFLRI